MHEATRQVLRFFEYTHLDGDQRQVSMKFHQLAHALVKSIEQGGYELEGPEATVGLRKLLEAKDCFVRSTIPDTQEPR